MILQLSLNDIDSSGDHGSLGVCLISLNLHDLMRKINELVYHSRLRGFAFEVFVLVRWLPLKFTETCHLFCLIHNTRRFTFPQKISAKLSATVLERDSNSAHRFQSPSQSDQLRYSYNYTKLINSFHFYIYDIYSISNDFASAESLTSTECDRLDTHISSCLESSQR